MEEELQKRNTDCVYFLASPLTCKKGIECEYRHNEVARLNPRDCWYWLAGNCLNPACAFRHPPLDGHTETGSESASANNKSALPVNKTSVPCFYFYNGFCNRGERCLFMHEPDGNATSWKSSKQASVVVDRPLLEKNMSKRSDSKPEPAILSSFGTDPNKSAAGSKIMSEQKSQQPTPNIVADQDASQHISESPNEEAASVRSMSQIHAEVFNWRTSDEYHISDSGSDDYINQEDRLVSSPGFDVLVNDRSANLDYKDEALYPFHHDMEEREISGQQLSYGYEDDMEYDPSFPEILVPFERVLPEYYGHLDEDTCNATRKTPFCARESVLGRIRLHKRAFLETEIARADLRDYLKKRHITERQHSKIFFGRPNYSCLMGCIGDRGLRGRLASRVEITGESRMGREPHISGTYQHRRTTHAFSKRSRKHAKERRHGRRRILSEISGQALSRKRRSAEDSTMFTGPKTLAQLREEKNKLLAGIDFCGRTVPSSSKAVGRSAS